MKSKRFDGTQMYNQQQHFKINRIRASMIATLFFLLKIYLIYWRNNAPTF